MRKFYFLFMSLITLITLTGQNKQSFISGTSQPMIHFTKVFRPQNVVNQKKSTLQRVCQVQSETNVLKQQLDSMVQPGYKSTYTYDNSGRKLTETNWYESTNSLIAMTKDSSVYNANGQLLTYIEFERNLATNNLVVSYKTDYQYNTNEKTEMKYSWNTASHTWASRDKTVDTYDNTGKIILALTSFWNVDSWTDEYKTVYEYDNQANKIVETFYYWSSGEWLNISKTMYNYDVNGNALGETSFSWSSNTQTWTGSDKSEYLLDNNFDISTVISSNWNTTTQMWEQSSKSEYFYDLNTLSSDVFSNGILNIFGKHKLTSAKLYNYDSTNWVYEGLATLYYSTRDFQSETKTVVDDAIKVYPNPASNYILFNQDKMAGQFTVQLVDLQGKIVLNQTSTNNNAVSIAKLSKGLYQYKILSDTKVYTGKIIVK